MIRSRRRAKKYVMISTVAERYGIHPQTLRLYEREGLLDPVRSAGNTRLYDQSALDRLESILTLTRDMGVNLAGVEVILRLQQQIAELRSEVERLKRSVELQGLQSRGDRFALVRVQQGSLIKLD